MSQLKTLFTVIGAATVLVLAANTVALAATGNALILGRSNSADKQTNVTRTTSGPVLRLNAKQQTNAPFTTNARGKVINLNADKVDGIDSAFLRTRTTVYSASYGGSTDYLQVDLPVPVGTYLISYSIEAADLGTSAIRCYIAEFFSPSGEKRVGMSAFQSSASVYSPALSGSGVAARREAGGVAIICESDGDTFGIGQPMQITVTPTKPTNGGALNVLVPIPIREKP
jgi:hypothetical protein